MIPLWFQFHCSCTSQLIIFDLGLKCRRRLQNVNVCPGKSKRSRLRRDTLFTEFCHPCPWNREWPSSQASRPHWAVQVQANGKLEYNCAFNKNNHFFFNYWNSTFCHNKRQKRSNTTRRKLRNYRIVCKPCNSDLLRENTIVEPFRKRYKFIIVRNVKCVCLLIHSYSYIK